MKLWSWNHLHDWDSGINRGMFSLGCYNKPDCFVRHCFLQLLLNCELCNLIPTSCWISLKGCRVLSSSHNISIRSILDFVFSILQMYKVCLVWILWAISIRPASIQVKTLKEDEAGICRMNLPTIPCSLSSSTIVDFLRVTASTQYRNAGMAHDSQSLLATMALSRTPLESRCRIYQ